MAGVRGGARAPARARLVTYGLVATMVVAAVAQVEAWPVTSFRLFSERRTGTTTVLVLEAVGVDGSWAPVDLSGDVRAMRSAQRQLPDLGELSPEARRAKVRAWLRLAGTDPATVREVRVASVRRRADPHGGPPTDLARRVVLRVDLR